MGLRTIMAFGETIASDFLLSDCVIGLALAHSIILHCTDKIHKRQASKLNAKLSIFQNNLTIRLSIFAPVYRHEAVFSSYFC